MDSGLGIISWILFGALAGWVASLIAGTNREQGWLENIIVGIIGAFLGGFLFSPLTGRGTYFDWNVGSFVVAVIGAVVSLFILRLVRRAWASLGKVISLNTVRDGEHHVPEGSRMREPASFSISSLGGRELRHRGSRGAYSTRL